MHILPDQAMWETSVTLPPNYGIIGLLMANLMAACVPMSFAIVSGLGFRALESAFSHALLNSTQISSGMIL